ncbi:MAG: PilZ domain-containing protein [Candidatus Omnitrophota bacterium]
MPTFEYRKLFRASINLKVKYKSIKDPSIEGVAFSRNISPTGINIVMPDKFERSEELNLQVYLSDKKPINAKGKIVWISECSFVPKSKKKYYSCGIQCTFMSSEDAISTSDFVRDVLKKTGNEQIRKIIEKLEEIQKS